MTEPRTCLEVCFDLLRQHGMTTIFGNPGSNEIPFLAGMPSDFTYVLGLHEGVVVGMADGYSQATGRPALVNLHAASGTGNAMGALTNSWYSHTPLVVVAGQQARELVGPEAMLANVDATTLPRPLVKSSKEPLSADDVPRSLSEAIFSAASSPSGPVYLSVPHDDWSRPARPNSELLLQRGVVDDRVLSEPALRRVVQFLAGAQRPGLVFGPDVDAAGANGDAVALAEATGAEVWVAPSAPRCPFPTTHPAFKGLLPMSVASVSSALGGYDRVLVVGAPVFRYHQHVPGDYLPLGTELLHLTCDPAEAARAPMGTSLVADIGPVMGQLAAQPWSGPADRSTEPAVRQRPEADGWTEESALNLVLDGLPEDAVIVNESTSNIYAIWNRMRATRPGSYYFPSSGGLGFAMPAAVGVQLAEPDRRVVAIVGDGSANYSLSALWTAAQLALPVIFVIVVNGRYRALDSFAATMQAETVPGTTLEGIDFQSLARGYGVTAAPAVDRDSLLAALDDAFSSSEPRLIEMAV